MTTNARTTGRTIGLLLLLHTFGAFVLNSVLLGPIFRAPGFLLNAAAEPNRIPLAMLLNLALAGVMLTIAILARPAFRQHGERLALAHLLVVAVCIPLTAGENVGLYTMQRVSNAFAADTAAVATAIEQSRVIAAGVRNGAHFTSVFVSGASLFIFYALLFRGRHLPRTLAGATAITALIQMFAVGRPFFGSPTDFRFLMPIAVMHTLAILWMIAKGFAEPADSSA